MHRRDAMIGFAALTALPFAATEALAQGTAIDKSKIKVLMGGDYATATSELAASSARSKSVKAFAELEIAEQAAVAEAFGSKPGAAGLSEKHTELVKKLQTAEGAEFGRLYIEGQIDGHEELPAIHKSYASSGDDPMARGAPIVGVTGIRTRL